MGENLKSTIEKFFKKNYEMKQGFIDELEEELKKESYDLSCIIQYNKNSDCYIELNK